MNKFYFSLNAKNISVRISNRRRICPKEKGYKKSLRKVMNNFLSSRYILFFNGNLKFFWPTYLDEKRRNCNDDTNCQVSTKNNVCVKMF